MVINGTIKVNKKNYYLNYDINTLCMMKSKGLDIMKLDQIEMDITVIRDLFYFGLIRFHKELTREDVGELMSDFIQEGGSFEMLADIITNALTKSLGLKVEEGEEQEGK